MVGEHETEDLRDSRAERLHSGGDWSVISGSAHPALASRVALLAGLPIQYTKLERFPDGEIKPQIRSPLHGKGAFIVQSTSPPVNDNLLELILSIAAVLDAGAEQVIAVIPYFGYARQCKKGSRGEPLSACVVAHLIEEAGAQAILTLDVHDPGVFNQTGVSLINVRIEEAVAEAIREHFPLDSEPVIVTPDEGGAERVWRVSTLLELPRAVLEKHRAHARDKPRAAVKECTLPTLNGRHAIIVDDIVTTGNTLIAAARTLREEGAEVLGAICTHGVFTPATTSRLADVALPLLLVSDSIPCSWTPPFVRQFPVAPVLANAITQFLGVRDRRVSPLKTREEDTPGTSREA